MQALEHISYYLVLAPHDNEQSDMLHRVYRYPALEKLELTRYVVASLQYGVPNFWPNAVLS